MKYLENLKKACDTDETITILGHDNIDVDSFLSGILLSNLLNYLKIKNEFIILEEVKEDETYRIVKELLGIDMKEYYSGKEDSSRKLFLQDHYETIHEGKVVACIDHHPTSRKIEYPFYYSRRSCSTSYMVYEIMKEAGYEISDEEAKMILVSMMIDTVSFRSAKTVEYETNIAYQIAEEYKLNYDEIEKYCLCLTPIEEMSYEEIVNNGFKYYNYNGNKVKSSYVQLYSKLPQRILYILIDIIKKLMEEENLQMWVFILFDCKENKTYEYRVKAGTEECEMHKYAGILSRGTNIMPEIERLFKIE